LFPKVSVLVLPLSFKPFAPLLFFFSPSSPKGGAHPPQPEIYAHDLTSDVQIVADDRCVCGPPPYSSRVRQPFSPQLSPSLVPSTTEFLPSFYPDLFSMFCRNFVLSTPPNSNKYSYSLFSLIFRFSDGTLSPSHVSYSPSTPFFRTNLSAVPPAHPPERISAGVSHTFFSGPVFGHPLRCEVPNGFLEVTLIVLFSPRQPLSPLHPAPRTVLVGNFHLSSDVRVPLNN